jgi:hypothetical protein
MILFNKHLMHEDRFPFATCLTTLHSLAALVLSSLLCQVAPSLFPSWHAVFGDSHRTDSLAYDVDDKAGNDVEAACLGLLHARLQALLPFAPLGICGVCSLVAGNWAYRYAEVAFLQIVKESGIVMVYALMVLFKLEALRWRCAVTLAFVAVAATCAVYGAEGAAFSLPGLLLQLLGLVGGSAQIVLTNRMMANSGGPKVDPMTMVLCTAPAMLVTLAPCNVIFWDARIPGRLYRYGYELFGNTVLACVLQVVMAVSIGRLSGTGYALASVTKDLFIVGSASFVLQEHLTWIQVCGFSGSVVGISLYSAMRLFPSLRGD